MTAFTDLAADTALRRVLLAKVQIGNRISLLDNYVWNDGSTHNFWEVDADYLNLRKLVRKITDPDGNPVTVERFAVSGVEYIEKKSADEVDITPGSFYHDDANNTIYARGHVVPFDTMFQQDHGSGNYRDWTAEAGNASTADAFRRIRIKGNSEDYSLWGMEFSRVGRIKLLFPMDDLPADKGSPASEREWVYVNGESGGLPTFAALSMTDLIGDTNWLTLGGTSGVYEGQFTPPSDWIRTATIGDDGTGTPTGKPTRFWFGSHVVAGHGYGSPGNNGSMLRAQTEAILEERRSVAWFVFRVANTLKNMDDDGIYLPYIPANSSGFNSLLEANDATIPIYGANQPTDAGTLDLGNGDAIFDAPLRSKEIDGLRQDYEWRGGLVDLFVTAEDPSAPAALSDYVQIGRSLTEGVVRADSKLQLRLMNQLRALDVATWLPIYSISNYRNMISSFVGKEIAALWGDTADLASDDTSKEAVWGRLVPTVRVRKGDENSKIKGQFANQGYKATCTIINPETGFRHGCKVTNVYIKYAAQNDVPSAPIDSSKYEIVEGGTAVNFTGDIFLYDGTDEVRFEMQGYIDDDAGTFTGTASAVIKRVEDILHFLWVCVAKKPTSMLNLATLCRVGLTKQGVTGTLAVPDAYRDNSCMYVNTQVNLKDLINSLCLQYLAVFQPGNDGRFSLMPMTVAVENTDQAYFEEDLAAFIDELSLDYVISSLTLGFRQLPADGSFQPVDSAQAKASPLPSLFPGFVIDDPSEAYGWPSKPIAVNTYMVTEASVIALNQVIFDWLKMGTIKTSSGAIIGSGLGQLLADRVEVTRSRAIGGAIEDRAMFQIRIERNYALGSLKFVAVEVGPPDAPTTVTPEGGEM